MTKMLTRQQAWWSKYLSSFHFSIHFHPGKLGAKPNALTCHFDVYPKGGEADYSSVNPQNYHSVFNKEQLITSLRATGLEPVVARAIKLVDMESLHSDILEGLKHDKFAQEQLCSIPFPPDSHYSVSTSGFLLIDLHIYVPNYRPQSGSIRTQVLQLKHNHITTGHPRQNRTLELLCREYTWPNVCMDIKDYINSCVSCKQNKALRHKPFGLIQQLPIPPHLWHLISFDLIEQLPVSKGHTAILNIVD